MIITILAVLLIIVGIILLAKKSYNNDFFDICGFVTILIGSIIAISCIILILCTQITKETKYQNTLYEREVLEYRIENADDNIVGNEMLYNDIVEFNNTLRSTKKWANNPFVNWFWNEDIATIDYIEFME